MTCSDAKPGADPGAAFNRYSATGPAVGPAVSDNKFAVVFVILEFDDIIGYGSDVLHLVHFDRVIVSNPDIIKITRSPLSNLH